jgi:alanyl-tRNA synthetase
MGKEDNFWAMGDTGPCGPCSEIIIDQGPEVGCGRPDCKVGCDCDRYLELWTLVFMQFNQDEKGVMTPLPKPSIDTGMGLERITAVVQGVKSNYDIDLLRNIIAFIEQLSEKGYGKELRDDISMQVIADHSRAVAFLIADGVIPSNEGRGYVLRRVIRRAVRHGKKLGLTKPFLFQTTGVVVDIMRDAYPELIEARNFIAQAVKNEEDRRAPAQSVHFPEAHVEQQGDQHCTFDGSQQKLANGCVIRFLRDAKEGFGHLVGSFFGI